MGALSSRRLDRRCACLVKSLRGMSAKGTLDVGVRFGDRAPVRIMGSEVVTPAPNSELGRLHPGRTLHRRFTNVFLWEGGRWRFLARQASVVAP